MFCSQCGAQNPDNVQFCSQCGAALAQAAPQAVVPAKTSRAAIASFVMGLLGLIVCPLAPILFIPSLICGIVGLVKISNSNGRLKGNGFAIAGLATSVLSLALFALLLPLVARNFLGQADKARVTVTKATLMTLHEAVNMFKMDTGRYPSEEVGLVELVEMPTDIQGWAQGGYLEGTKVPKDSWKNDFVFLLNPESGKPFVIISYGADGMEGGEGYDADLYSTDLE